MTPSGPERAGQDPIQRAFDDVQGVPVLHTTPQVGLGGVVGPYELTALLGEGGFGTVYLAEQSAPLRRTVALKVLRAAVHSQEATRRFEAERQVLARLEHPGIAAIHDAGVTDLGQPYFVMDFVDGQPITAFCDTHRLGIRARVALMRDVCLAVQHAHQRGVIHRDLKPSNILVREGAEGPAAKVIDFGIAKVVHDEENEASLLTLTGQVMGTPEYMSPEQAAGGARELDTRSDVYSLGVVLYELLTGELPLEPRSDAGLESTLRAIREDDPPRPSTRIRALTASSARKEPQERRALTRTLRGDLDWISLKALEKDADRRYASPLEFARDLERYLAGEAVAASPPSKRYRASKFARRHRTPLIAASLVALSLLGGVISTSYFLVRSLANERDAVAGRQRAEALRLAGQARLLAEREPTRALLLSIEAASTGLRHPAIHEAAYAALAEQYEARVLYGQQSAISALAFDEEGRRLVSSGRYDPFLLVWDVARSAVQKRLELGGAGALEVLFAAGGARLLAARMDGGWSVWDTEDWTRLASHGPAVRSVAPGGLDPSGEHVVVADGDGGAALVGALSGEVVGALDGSAGVITVRFVDAGRRLVTVHTDGSARAWSVPDLERTALAPPLERRYTRRGLGGAAVAPDGRHFALWLDPLSKEPVTWVRSLVDGSTRRLPGLYALEFSADGDVLHLASGGVRSQHWMRYDVQEGRQLDTLEAPSGVPLHVLDRDRIAWRVEGEATYILDARTARSATGRTPLVGHRYAARAVAFDPSSRRLATGAEDRTIRLWNPEPVTRARRVVGEGEAVVGERALVVSGRDVRVLAEAADASGAAYVVRDALSGRELLRSGPEALEVAHLTPDGSHLLGVLELGGVAGLGGRVDDAPGRLVAWSLPSGERSERSAPPLMSACPSPGLAEVLMSPPYSSGRDFGLVDWASGAIRSLPREVGSARVNGEWSADGGWLAYQFEHERTRVLRWPSTTPVHTVAGHSADHRAFAFDAECRRLLTVAIDGTAVVWDLDTGEAVSRYRGRTSVPRAAGLVPDGRLAWVLCGDALSLFDAADGSPFARVEPRAGQFASAATAPEGDAVLTVTTSGWLQRWPLDPIAAARAHAPRALEPFELADLEIGRPEERAARIEAAALQTPIAAELLRAGSLLEEMGALDGALRLAEEAVTLAPHLTAPWLELARVHAKAAQSPSGRGDGAAARARAIEALARARDLGAAIGPTLELPEFVVLRDDAATRALVPR